MNTNEILDPVCDMVVELPTARANGLTSTFQDREYGFCGPGCKRRFDADPARYTAKVTDWLRRSER